MGCCCLEALESPDSVVELVHDELVPPTPGGGAGERAHVYNNDKQCTIDEATSSAGMDDFVHVSDDDGEYIHVI